MDFINTALVALKTPTGFWESILGAFKNGVGSYVVAVILVAIIVRVLFSLVDIVNKKVNAKNSAINEKMRPELEAIQKKYGNDQRVMQQKQAEVYRKYQFSMLGSCFPMLISMVLQFTVFLTLWNSLQAVSNFNIVEKYENMKNVYANVIALNEDTALQSYTYQDGDVLSLQIETTDDGKNVINLTVSNQTSGTSEVFGNIEFKDFTNEEMADLFDKYVIDYDDDASANAIYSPNELSEQILTLAQDAAKDSYKESQESFLWIKNIYKPESTTNPLFSKSEIIKYLSSFYKSEEFTDVAKVTEEKIFDCVIENNSALSELKKQKNGFYILTIIAVISSFLSMWLSNYLMKEKQPKLSKEQKRALKELQKGQKKPNMMMFVLPIVFGLFTMMYTSLFAIYIIVGQLVMIALTPLTTWLVKKWVKADEKKQKDKNVIDVDYRRK